MKPINVVFRQSTALSYIALGWLAGVALASIQALDAQHEGLLNTTATEFAAMQEDDRGHRLEISKFRAHLREVKSQKKELTNCVQRLDERIEKLLAERRNLVGAKKANQPPPADKTNIAVRH